MRQGPWASAARRLSRNRPALVGAAVLLVLTFACLLGPWLLGLDAMATSPQLRNRPPSSEHWFGTDAIGRDLFARVLVGGQASLAVGVVATLVSVLVLSGTHCSLDSQPSLVSTRQMSLQ